ncbi:hypothetical protein IFM89_032331 [Coptis chinensis]|uniref:Uncharacterized protein n=1 Tax=Coptis chinensis TaxID=261450 RepID=A0A835M230_9MAGN|nr:hypothetical protein IFM89_032331 [Coptis chinensis]
MKMIHFSLVVTFFGVAAFIFGVLAENYKYYSGLFSISILIFFFKFPHQPAAGTAIPGKDVVICKFPSDPSVGFGSASFVAIILTTIAGIMSVFHSYKGISVPKAVLFKSTALVTFFWVAIFVTIFGGAMMLWATVSEGLHRVRNVHHTLDYACPTAKTGLFGGAAFLALDASLFWLICQMLTKNSREDHLEDDPKGEYGEVLATDFAPKI